jgi:hypothetical protein
LEPIVTLAPARIGVILGMIRSVRWLEQSLRWVTFVSMRALCLSKRSRAPGFGAALIACSGNGLLGCGGHNSEASIEKSLPDATAIQSVESTATDATTPGDAALDGFDGAARDGFVDVPSAIEPGRRTRGFVGVEQFYEDQPQGPMLIAEQLFVTELPCTRDFLCTWTTQANECGGVTSGVDGYIGDRSFGGLIPFYPGQLAKNVSAGRVTVTGEMGQTIVVPNNTPTGGVVPSREPVVKFQPMETIHVAASGAFVPPFAADLQVPSRVTFTAPDVSRAIPSKESPLEIRWTANGSVGMVEVWHVCMFAPDLHISAGITQCAAPVSAGRLVVPPPPPCESPGQPHYAGGITVRVVNTIHHQVGAWDVQLSAASFDSFVPFADSPSDGGAPVGD